MRLIRIGEQRSRVAEDIRAGLTALGRGGSVTGGIGLVDVTPHGCAESIDAVVVLPHGVLIVAGVDLPGPTMRLEAPLAGQWKADGWPLVGSGSAVNPASGALAVADQLAQRLHTLTNGSLRIGVILAVGPYVDSATTPDVGPDGGVKVLFPTPSQLRDAIGALIPPQGQPFTVEQGRAVLRAIDPKAPIQPDGMLRLEGFLVGGTASSPYAQPAEVTTKLPAIPSVPAVGTPGANDASARRTPAAAPRKQRSRARWFPFASIGLLIAGLAAAISAAAGGTTPTGTLEQKPPARHAIAGVRYTEVATKADAGCAQHTFGDVQASLERTHCAGMHLGSFLAEVAGKRAAVSIAVIRFDQQAHAQALKRIAEKPGTGGGVDLATQAGAWPDEAPNFDNAAYRSMVVGAEVRLVRATWMDEPTQPHDTLLARIAETANEVPVAG